MLQPKQYPLDINERGTAQQMFDQALSGTSLRSKTKPSILGLDGSHDARQRAVLRFVLQGKDGHTGFVAAGVAADGLFANELSPSIEDRYRR